MAGRNSVRDGAMCNRFLAAAVLTLQMMDADLRDRRCARSPAGADLRDGSHAIVHPTALAALDVNATRRLRRQGETAHKGKPTARVKQQPVLRD